MEEPPSQHEENLIDLGDHDAKALPKDGENGTSEPPARRASYVEPPAPRFLIRKQNGDATHETVAKVSTTDEIREHLKHLGPSNLASNPRQTRYQSVTIKPGGVSPTRSGCSARRMSDDLSKAPPLVQYHTDSGAGIIQSAGISAKDGVQALRAGYGTMTDHPRILNGTASQVSEAQSGYIRPLPKINIPEAVEEVEADGSQNSRPVSSESANSSDHLQANAQHHVPARSGSITEQVVDVNGVTKVILETNSGSSSETERPHQNHDDQDGSTTKDHHKTSDDSDGGSHGPKETGQSVSKKRRRRKKRNAQPKQPGGGDVEQSLLDR